MTISCSNFAQKKRIHHKAPHPLTVTGSRQTPTAETVESVRHSHSSLLVQEYRVTEIQVLPPQRPCHSLLPSSFQPSRPTSKPVPRRKQHDDNFDISVVGNQSARQTQKASAMEQPTTGKKRLTTSTKASVQTTALKQQKTHYPNSPHCPFERLPFRAHRSLSTADGNLSSLPTPCCSRIESALITTPNIIVAVYVKLSTKGPATQPPNHR